MKKLLITTKTLLRVFLLVSLFLEVDITYGQFNQKLLSESWSKTGGQGLAYRNVTATDGSRNVYVAGATMSGVNNSDIIVQKLSHTGTLIWEQTYAGSAGMNDAATAIFIDNSNNVYITGTVVNSVMNDQDMIVLKYNSSGTLLWNFVYHGSNIYVQDAGTAIVGDPLGSRLFVTGTSGSDATMFNYKTFSLSPSTGSVIWTQSYDYDSLVEIPKKILYSGSYVTVIGASQESLSPVHWEMATVRYNYSTGALVDVVRSSSSTVTGINEINDVAVDNATGATYLIGALENSTTGFDVAVYKLDASLNLVWEHYYDIHGMEDKGTGIEFVSGNLYLTGYSTKTGFGKETLLMKINGSGTVLWQKEISGSKGLDDKGEQIMLDANNRVYIAASVNDGNSLDYKLYCYDASGIFITAASFNGTNNLNDIPQSIEIDLDNNIIITGSEQINPTTYVTKIVKYALFERTYDYVYDGDKPTHLKGTMLVRFKADKMKSDAMNSRKFHAGELSQFIDSATLSAMHLKTGYDWSRYKTYKVLKNTTPADSISITRLGTAIRANDLWTYLSIDVPKEWDIPVMCDSLRTLEGFIREADRDILCELYSTPHDNLYETGQLGLYQNATYPDADINVADAWDIEVGQSYVKVGILDAPVSWSHEEFNDGEQNLPGADKKIGGGYNYYANSEIHVSDQYTSYAHGTSVAGIVGAKRNNYAPGVDAYAQGVAGIGGGDMSQGNFGVQLYSLGISASGTTFAPYNVIADAMHSGYSDSPSNDQDYGLNLINGSWGTTVGPIPILGDQIEECWKNHCVYVAARGQYEDGGSNFAAWPACYNDLQVINVMASGTDGKLKSIIAQNGDGDWSSNFGLSGENNTLGCPADLMAPGTIELVSSVTPFNNYSTFSGTSASAPHVTGVASLMYSQHHLNNGFPNNLGTEDIENIMQKTAVDMGVTGPDLESGYGLLDAYEAIKQVSDPYYVKHLTGTPSQTISSITVVFPYNPNDNFPDGSFPSSKRYLINWDIDVTLPAGHEIIDWWELEAANVKGRVYNSNPSITMLPIDYMTTNMVFDPIGGNHVHKTATTAIYLVNVGNDGNTNNDFWYPMNPSELKYYFSVHVKKSADAGIEELDSENFLLYPNPANQQITISSKTAAQILSYEIVDATGRVVAKENKMKSNDFTINLVSLNQGVYYCRIFSENSVETIPFIKSKE